MSAGELASKTAVAPALAANARKTDVTVRYQQVNSSAATYMSEVLQVNKPLSLTCDSVS